MAISIRTRKNLWAKSGNRCSICKIELFSKKQNSDEVNIGEECHIISSKPNGPRYKPDLDNYDLIDNLILLCRNHHREIDERTNFYTEALLKQIKLEHEKWVRNAINNTLDSDHKIKQKRLNRITSGKELFNILSNSYGLRTDYDDVDNEVDAEFIGRILQDIFDFADLSSIAEPYDKVRIGVELKKLLNDLEEKNFHLIGNQFIEQMNFANGEKDKWPIATIVIKKNN